LKGFFFSIKLQKRTQVVFWVGMGSGVFVCLYNSPFYSSTSSFPKLWFEAPLYKLFYREVVAFHYYYYFMMIIIITSFVCCWSLHFFFLLIFVICLFLHLGSSICSWVGDYVLLDNGGCSGDTNTTKKNKKNCSFRPFPP